MTRLDMNMGQEPTVAPAPSAYGQQNAQQVAADPLERKKRYEQFVDRLTQYEAQRQQAEQEKYARVRNTLEEVEAKRQKWMQQQKKDQEEAKKRLSIMETHPEAVVSAGKWQEMDTVLGSKPGVTPEQATKTYEFTPGERLYAAMNLYKNLEKRWKKKWTGKDHDKMPFPMRLADIIASRFDEEGGGDVNALAFMRSLPVIRGLKGGVDALKIQAAQRKIQSGIGTPEDYLIYGASIVDAQRRKDFNWLQNAREIMIDMPGWAGELWLLGPLYEAGAAATGRVALGAMEKLAGESVMKAAMGNLAGRLAIKGTVGAAKIIGGTAAGYASPIGHVGIPGMLTRYMTDQIGVAPDDAGRLKVEVQKKGDSFIKALGKSYVDDFIEKATERMGGPVDEMLGGLVGKAGKALRKTMGDAALAGTIATLAKVGWKSSRILGALARKAGVNGIIGEMYEERAGEVIRAAVGMGQGGIIPELAESLKAWGSGDDKAAREHFMNAVSQAGAELLGFGAFGVGHVAVGMAYGQEIIDWNRRAKDTADRLLLDNANEVYKHTEPMKEQMHSPEMAAQWAAGLDMFAQAANSGQEMTEQQIADLQHQAELRTNNLVRAADINNGVPSRKAWAMYGPSYRATAEERKQFVEWVRPIAEQTTQQWADQMQQQREATNAEQNQETGPSDGGSVPREEQPWNPEGGGVRVPPGGQGEGQAQEGQAQTQEPIAPDVSDAMDEALAMEADLRETLDNLAREYDDIDEQLGQMSEEELQSPEAQPIWDRQAEINYEMTKVADQIKAVGETIQTLREERTKKRAEKPKTEQPKKPVEAPPAETTRTQETTGELSTDEKQHARLLDEYKNAKTKYEGILEERDAALAQIGGLSELHKLKEGDSAKAHYERLADEAEKAYDEYERIYAELTSLEDKLESRKPSEQKEQGRTSASAEKQEEPKKPQAGKPQTPQQKPEQREQAAQGPPEQSGQKEVSKALHKYFNADAEFVEPPKLPRESQKILESFPHLDIHWFKDDLGRLPRAFTINGNVAFNANRMKNLDHRVLTYVIGHEVAHATGVDKIVELFTEKEIRGAFGAYRRAMHPEYKRLLEELSSRDPKAYEQLMRREGAAHLIGKFMEDKAFRDQLLERDKTIWEKIVDAILRALGLKNVTLDEKHRKVLDELRKARGQVQETTQEEQEATTAEPQKQKPSEKKPSPSETPTTEKGLSESDVKAKLLRNGAASTSGMSVKIVADEARDGAFAVESVVGGIRSTSEAPPFMDGWTLDEARDQAMSILRQSGAFEQPEKETEKTPNIDDFSEDELNDLIIRELSGEKPVENPLKEMKKPTRKPEKTKTGQQELPGMTNEAIHLEAKEAWVQKLASDAEGFVGKSFADDVRPLLARLFEDITKRIDKGVYFNNERNLDIAGDLIDRITLPEVPDATATKDGLKLFLMRLQGATRSLLDDAASQVLDTYSEQEQLVLIESDYTTKNHPKLKKPKKPRKPRKPRKPKKPKSPKQEPEQEGIQADIKKALDDLRDLGIKFAPERVPVDLKPEGIRVVARVAARAVKEGRREFKPFVQLFQQQVPDEGLLKLAPYLEAAWDVLRQRFGDQVGPVRSTAQVLQELHDEQEQEQPPIPEPPSGPSARPPGGRTPEGGRRGQGGGKAGATGGTHGQGGGGSVRKPGENGGRSGGGETEGDAGSGIHTGSSGVDTDTSRDNSAGLHWTILDDDELLSGGTVTRFERNLAAMRLLIQLEKEGRLATAEEQKVLALFTGWGQFKSGSVTAEGQPIGEYFLTMSQLQRMGLYGEKRGKTWNEQALARMPENTPEERRRKALLETLPPDEYEKARSSVRFSHYTSPEVARAMWKWIADNIGQQHARLRVAEVAEGSGIFWGTMPKGLRTNAKMLGIEPDIISYRIARQLYQDVKHENRPLQDVPIPDNYFDIMISNFPFNRRNHPIDLNDKLPAAPKLNLHNYFPWKAALKLRPGGILVAITSHFALDATDPAVRKLYDSMGLKLLGAVRLPREAFRRIANTKVVTDIVVFQKGETNPVASDQWIETVEVRLGHLTKDKIKNVKRNQYFSKHPEKIVGREYVGRGQYADNEYIVIHPDISTLAGDIDNALYDIPIAKELWDSGEGVDEEKLEEVNDVIDMPKGMEHVPIGQMFIHDNAFYIRRQNNEATLIRAKLGVKRIKRAKAFFALRDVTMELLKAQVDKRSTDNYLDSLRETLNERYDDFVKEYGPVNDRPNVLLFMFDVTYPNVSALENWNPIKKVATKRDIFRMRTSVPPEIPRSADSPKQALIYSMQFKGAVDPDYMASLINMPVSDMMKAVEDYVFQDPADDSYVIKEDYLSGNVRKKLKVAQKAAEKDEKYQRNVAALKEVIPKDIGRDKIYMEIGSPWIPTDLYESFIQETLGVGNVRVIKNPGDRGGIRVDFSRAQGRDNSVNKEQFGVGKWDGVRLFSRIVQHQSLQVKIEGVVDQSLTRRAQAIAARFKHLFESYMWGTTERANRLIETYNEKFRAIVEPTFPEWIVSLSGMSEVWKKQIRKYQRQGAARFILRGNTMYAYDVGFGKTLTAIAGIMEARNMGVITKPMVVVPNHLVSQWASMWLDYYPNAKLLVARESDMTPKNRARFAASAATGDWDAIIIRQSAFELMPMSPSYVEQFIHDQLLEIQQAIENSGGDPATLAQLENALAEARKRLQKMLNASKKDSGPYFDTIGIDALAIDEAHEYKNLFFPTRLSGIPGVPNNQVQKTFDMLMKTDFINTLSNNRGLIFITGTPLTNTIAEAWVMQRYLQPHTLREAGLYAFDDWANVFGSIVNEARVDPLGRGLRNEERFSRFLNVPEVRRMWTMTTDIKLRKDVDIVLPPIKGGAPEIVEIIPDDATKDYMDGIACRMLNFDPKNKRFDNILVMMGDGAKMAIDPRLMDPNMTPVSETKLTKAVDIAADVYERTTPFLGTQIIWLDRGTPKQAKKLSDEMKQLGKWILEQTDKGGELTIPEIREKWSEINKGKPRISTPLLNFLRMIEEEVQWIPGDPDSTQSVKLNSGQFVDGILAAEPSIIEEKPPAWNAYEEIKRGLIARGIPEDEIKFIHDAPKDADKVALFDAMNEGSVRILIASTPKLGVGANVQKRLFGMIHVDVPMRPDLLAQRNGRQIRSGNETVYPDENGELRGLAVDAIDADGVEIYYLVAKGTVDARYWQIVETKARWQQQFYEGDESMRVLDDTGTQSDLFEQIKSNAAGNPMMGEMLELRQKVEELESEKDGFEQDLEQARRRVIALEEEKIPRTETALKRAKEEQAKFEKVKERLPKDAKIELVIGDKTYHKTTEAAKALMFRMMEMTKDLEMHEFFPQEIEATKEALSGKQALANTVNAISEKRREFNAEMSSPETIGTVYGRPLTVQVVQGWRHEETGETRAGNNWQEYLISQMPEEEQKKWRWGFGGAIFSLHPEAANRTRIVTELKDGSFSGKANGNIQILNNIFRKFEKDIPAFTQALENMRKELDDAKKLAEEVWPKADELVRTQQRLNQVVDELGTTSDRHIKWWVPSQVLFNTFDPTTAGMRRLLMRAGATPQMIGTIDVGGKADVYTGKPTEKTPTTIEELKAVMPPSPSTVWLEPREPGAPSGWESVNPLGQVLGQAPFGDKDRRIDEGQGPEEEGEGELPLLAPEDPVAHLRYPNKEVERRMSHEKPKYTVMDNMVRVLNDAFGPGWRSHKFVPEGGGIGGLTREGRERGARLAPYRELLRQLPLQAANAERTTRETMDYNLTPLKKESADYFLFSRLLMFRDIFHGVTEKGEPFRFGLELDENKQPRHFQQSIDEMREYLDTLEAEARKRPKVLEALRRRETMVTAMVTKLVSYSILPKSALENAPYYWHRIVMDYWYASYDKKFPGAKHKRIDIRAPSTIERAGGGGPQILKQSFQRPRITAEGEEERPGLDEQYDFSSSYVDSEIAWMFQANWSMNIHDWWRKLEAITPSMSMAKLRKEARFRNWMELIGGEPTRQKLEVLTELINGPGSAIRDVDDATWTWLGIDERPETVKKWKSLLRQRRRDLDPTMEFRQRKMMFLRMVANETGAHWIMDADQDDPSVIAFLRKLRRTENEGEPGHGPAVGFFATVSKEARFTRDQLGEKYQDWKTLLREQPDYTLYQVKPGNLLYPVYTVADHVAEALMLELEDTLEISKDDLHRVLAFGPKNRQAIIPVEVAQQLKYLERKKKQTGLGSLDRFVVKMMGIWKQWTLLNPARWAPYNIRNMTGDIAPVLVAHPGILRWLPQAVREMREYAKSKGRRRVRTQQMRIAQNEGVIGSGWATAEVLRKKDVEELETLVEKHKGLAHGAKAFLSGYWNLMTRSTQFREDMLRYAGFLYFLDTFQNGKPLKHYGASRKRDIDAILQSPLGPETAAVRMTNDLLGDYTNISVIGNFLRTRVAPFWSFQEIQLKRWPRMAMNAVEAGMMADGTPVTKLAIGSASVLALGLPYMFLTLFNRLTFPDLEDELSAFDRANPHLLYGRMPDGTIGVFRNVGALGDFLEWFGVNTFLSRYEQWSNDQVTTGDLLKEMAKDPVNKFAQSIGPQWTVPLTMITGRGSFPDVFNRRQVDRWEEAFGSLSMRDTYREISGRIWGTGLRARPGSPAATVSKVLGLTKLEKPSYTIPWRTIGIGDPRRYALFEAYELRDNFLKSMGEGSTTRGNEYFRAMRDATNVGDFAAFRQARSAYIRDKLKKPTIKDVGDVYRSFRASLRNMDPIGPRLNEDAEQAFWKWLSSPQRIRVKMARQYAHDMQIQMWSWWNRASKVDDAKPVQQRLNTEVQAQIGRVMDTLARPKPMRLTREQRLKGLKLSDLRTKWQQDRTEALQWLREHRVQADTAKQAYRSYLKRAYRRQRTRFLKMLNASRSLDSIPQSAG